MALGKFTTGTVTQRFGIATVHIPGHEVGYPEPSAWLQSDDGGARRARKTKFANSVLREHVHVGIDIANDMGTPLIAPCRVKLLQAGTYDETGEHYVIFGIHKNVARLWDTVGFYTHCKADSVTKPIGTIYTLAAKIAAMGKSGMATGPHLHAEIRHSFAPDPGPVRLSSSWFKYNPKRLQAGGDLADVPWIVPNF